MILRAPCEFEPKFASGSSKAYIAKRKYEQNLRLWQLATQAMAAADPGECSVRTQY